MAARSQLTNETAPGHVPEVAGTLGHIAVQGYYFDQDDV